MEHDGVCSMPEVWSSRITSFQPTKEEGVPVKRKETLGLREDGEAATGKLARFSLRFQPPLEERFNREHDARWRRESLVTGVIGLCFHDLFLQSDYAMSPSLLWRGVVFRLFLFTPCALLCLLTIARTRRRAVREGCKLGMVALSGAGSLWIISGYGGPPAVIGQAGLVVIAFFGAIVYRISFPYAVVTNALLFAEELLFVHFNRLLTAGVTTACVLLVGGCALLSLLANYRLERSERTSYLLLLASEEQGIRLKGLNTVLEEISTRDGLTGLPNRRRFDEYSQSVSEETWRTGLPVSVVMADIDHFKRFNDTFGHLAGDSVLLQVAEAVRSCVRGGNDLAARFGGEEFIMILPGADGADAMLVAERVVGAVRHESMTISGSDQPIAVTISAGVASGKAADGITLTELIARADRALYEAKRAGRDQACSAERELTVKSVS